MTADGDAAIVAEGLHKRFKRTHALRGLDLSVPAGTVCGLLGPNGAGKTTAVRILATLTAPDAGRARVAGHDVQRDPARVRERIGLAGQHAAVDEKLSGRDNLRMFGRLYHLPGRLARRRAGELLDQFGLTGAADRVVKGYSGGMRRKLDLAASLIVAPPVLFMDEPTTGLDPRSRSDIWAGISALAAGGTTVLLTTQYMDEADHLAGRIAVVDSGRVIASGTPGQLKAAIGGRLTVVVKDTGAPGGNYREYLMPGLFAMSAFTGVIATTVIVAGDAAKGVMDRFRSMPMARLAVPFGQTGADIVTGAVGLAIMVGCGLAVGWRPHASAGDMLAAAALLILLRYAVSWAGVYIGLAVRNEETADQLVPLIFPLTMISNTFVPTSHMPAWLRIISEWNPVSALVAATRQLLGSVAAPGRPGAWPLAHPVPATLAWAAVLLAVFVPLSVRRYATARR